MRKRELAKINTLEEKLDSESETIDKTSKRLETELEKYRNVDKLHQDGEAQEAQLLKKEAVLKNRVDLLKESAEMIERMTMAMGTKLSVCCRISHIAH
jgi:hypothetical protein